MPMYDLLASTRVCLSDSSSHAHFCQCTKYYIVHLRSSVFCLSATIATFPAVRLRLFVINVYTQVSITVVVLNVSPGSGCHEHRASVPLSNLQQQQQQKHHSLMGSRLTVLCRAHVEAITADVSGMQICSKWLTICPPYSSCFLSLPL